MIAPTSAIARKGMMNRELFWADLIRRFEGRLRAYARRTRCSSGEEEEIAWDVWQLAAQHEDLITNCQNQWPLLRGFLRQVCAERLRVWRNESATVRGAIGGLRGPGDHAITRDVEWLDGAMQSLPKQQRLAVDFRYRWSWPYWAVAAALECEEATARVHVFKGLQKLREIALRLPHRPGGGGTFPFAVELNGRHGD